MGAVALLGASARRVPRRLGPARLRLAIGPLAAAALAALAALTTGCAAPLVPDDTNVDAAELHARATAALQRPRARAEAHLALAWLCLWRGHGCEALPRHAGAATVGSGLPQLALVTRALGLQGTADVAARTHAWIDVAWWAVTAPEGAPQAPEARAQAEVAARSLLAAVGLARADHAACAEALRQRIAEVGVILDAVPVALRWRIRGQLAGLILPKELPTLAAEDAARPAIRLHHGRWPLSRRAWAGLDGLGPAWPQQAALAAEASLVLPQPDGAAGELAFALPPVPTGVWPLAARAQVPGGAWALVAATAHQARICYVEGAAAPAGGPVAAPPGPAPSPSSSPPSPSSPLSPSSPSSPPAVERRSADATTAGHCASAGLRWAAGWHVLPLPPRATPWPLELRLALARPGAADELTVALVPWPQAQAVASQPASAAPTTWHERAWRDAWADAGGPADAQTPLAALIAWERSLAAPAGPAHDTTAALADGMLDAFPYHIDATLARAAAARADGQAPLARSMIDELQARARGAEPLLGRWPGPVLQRGWIDLAEGLGDHAATAALQAQRLQPRDCATLRDALDLASTSLERPLLRALLQGAPPCPALRLQLADASASVGAIEPATARWTEALAQPAQRAQAAARLAALRALRGGDGSDDPPAAAPPAPATATATAVVDAEDGARARAGAAWRAAQRCLARDDAACAAPHLQALLLGPGVDADLRLRAWRLGAPAPWRAFVHDGAAVAAAPAADPEGGQIDWLLDQEIVVLLPGGGALRRRHQLARLVDADAATTLGEVSIAPDTEVEVARTYAAEGEILAPAATPDKETLSLRGVTPGAVVELAQLQVHMADDPASGATRLPAFVLGADSGPTRHAELLVLAPPGVTPQWSLGAAAPVAEPLGAGLPAGWRGWRYVRRQAPRWRPEPRANRAEQHLAAVQVSASTSLAALSEQAHDVLWAHQQRQDAAWEPWLARARAAGRDAEAWRRLVAQLFRVVEEGSVTALPGAPGRALSEGKGDRAALLWHLATRVGVPACLVRAVPWTRTPLGPHVEAGDFGLGAVTLALDGGPPRWFDGGIDGGLIDVLRPGLRDRPALLLGCAQAAGAALVQTPTLGAAGDAREVTIRLQWGQDGRVQVEGEDVLAGALAVTVRNVLRGGDEAARASVLQQLISASLPGMSYRWQAITGLDDDREPLRLRWRAEAPAAAERATRLRLGLVPYRLAREYATLAERTLPLRVGHQLDLRVRLEINSDGARIQPVDDVQTQGPLVALQRVVQRAGARVAIEHRLRVTMGVVAPVAYRAFAAAMRAVDAAEDVHLQRDRL